MIPFIRSARALPRYTAAREGASVKDGDYDRMTDTIDIGALIDHVPDIHSNRPKIAGTGVTVRRIAGWYTLGYTPEEIVRKIPHLSLAQVHAALAYYHANRAEIEHDIASEDALYEKLAAEQASRGS